MKRFRLLFLFFVFISNTVWAEIVEIPDPNLRHALEQTLEITAGGDITKEALAGLVKLIAEEKKITNLTGLEHCTSLSDLKLSKNQISDISPLANLIWLERLYLNTNQINDISPLTNLTNLTDLKLPGNKITSIDVLANMTDLTKLELHNNRVSDLTPLAGLTNLDYLHLSNNRISDISPLVKNEGIQGHIWLKNNPLSKVSALTHLSATS